MGNLSLLLKSQLQEKEDLAVVIKKLVHLIPARSFYYPEVRHHPTYRDYQMDIQCLVQDVRKYKRPSDKEMLGSLIRQYEEELRNLVKGKRRWLEENLLRLEKDQQIQDILFFAAKYHKEKFLLETKKRR
jgi:hypothetical protein